MDSPERVLETLSADRGATQYASRKACAALEDEIPVKEFPRVDEAFVEASLVEATSAPPPLRARRASFTVYDAWRPPDRLVLRSYVEPMECDRLMKDASAPDYETNLVLINY